MAQPNLRVVIPDQLHPRDIARREVKRFMLDREKDDRQTVCNQHSGQVASQLWVDEVLDRTERVIPEETREPYKPHPFLIRFLAFALIAGLIAVSVWAVKSF